MVCLPVGGLLFFFAVLLLWGGVLADLSVALLIRSEEGNGVVECTHPDFSMSFVCSCHHLPWALRMGAALVYLACKPSLAFYNLMCMFFDAT